MHNASVTTTRKVLVTTLSEVNSFAGASYLYAYYF